MSARGYTLVELAVALLVLSAAVALATPAIPRHRDSSEARAREIVRLVDRTRLQAAREQRVLGIELDPRHNQARIFAQDAYQRDSLLSDVPLGSFADVAIESRAADESFRIRLHPLGRAAGGPFVVRGRTTRTVIIEPWGGRPRVEMP